MLSNTQTILVEIKNLCKIRNVRLTPQRLAILKLISQYNKAISAYDLLNLLRQSSSPNAKPSTIYRALNFLLAQGFIHRIESTNSFMLCRYFYKLSHNFIVFICNRCEQVNETTIEDTKMKQFLQKIAETIGFVVFNKIIEAHGLCIKCIDDIKKNTSQ